MDDALGVALFDLGSDIRRVAEALEATEDRDALAHAFRVLDYSEGFENKGLKQQLAGTADDLASRLGRMLDHNEKVDVEDSAFPLVRSLKGATDRWDWERLVPRICAQVADEAGFDSVTGVAVPPGVLAERVGLALADCAALTPSKSGRKGSIKARGLEPRDFIERDGGRPSVRWKASR